MRDCWNQLTSNAKVQDGLQRNSQNAVARSVADFFFLHQQRQDIINLEAALMELNSRLGCLYPQTAKKIKNNSTFLNI